MVGDVRRELGVGWLSGNFKDGSHGFKLCPRGLLSEHFYHCATYTPETEAEVKQQVTTESCPSRKTRSSRGTKISQTSRIHVTLESNFSMKQAQEKTGTYCCTFISVTQITIYVSTLLLPWAESHYLSEGIITYLTRQYQLW